MMSPKSIAFIQYLKKVSGIPFGVANAKASMNKTTTNLMRQPKFELDSATYQGFMIQSKDKRNQLHPMDVKTFVTEENQRKHVLGAQKRQTQSITSELTGSMHAYMSSGQQRDTRLMNNTMPVSGLVTAQEQVAGLADEDRASKG